MSRAASEPDEGDYRCPSLARATVADAMCPGILECPADAPLRVLARITATRRVHCVAVIGTAKDQGEPQVWGIVSDLDAVTPAALGL